MKRLTVPMQMARSLGIALGLLALVIVACVLHRYVAPHTPADRMALIQTLAQILGAIGLGGTLYFTGRQLAATNRSLAISRDQLATAREGQITDRFSRAVDQLGDDKLPSRLGGVYALERIARDSVRDHWAVVDILAAYVRERAYVGDAQVPGQPSLAQPVDDETMLENLVRARLQMPIDIQVVLTVLGRREHRDDEKGRHVDLHHTTLRWADLRDCHLDGALLWESSLDRVDLRRASLRGALLSDTHLKNAMLVEARLEGAYLVGARFDGADLRAVHLEGAYLTGASFDPLIEGVRLGADLSDAQLAGAVLLNASLRYANLRGASLGATVPYPAATLMQARLDGAILQGARLDGVNFERASLDGTDLRGVDLRNVVNLTQAQVDTALTDDRTQLPVGLVLSQVGSSTGRP